MYFYRVHNDEIEHDLDPTTNESGYRRIFKGERYLNKLWERSVDRGKVLALPPPPMSKSKKSVASRSWSSSSSGGGNEAKKLETLETEDRAVKRITALVIPGPRVSIPC